MSEPKRWLDDASELSAEERRALEAALGTPAAGEIALAEQAKHAVWSALVTKLPVASGAVAGTAALAVGKATFVATLAKPLAIGLVLGAGTAGGLGLILRTPAPRPPEVQGPRRSEPAQAPRALDPRPATGSFGQVPAPSTSTGQSQTRGAGVAPRAPDTSSMAAPLTAGAGSVPAPGHGPSVASFPTAATPAEDPTEIHRMAAARALLRSSQPRAALRELDAIGRDFPNGTLVQEREALAVEALGALGELAAARERAARFLARYPTSPHAAVVRRALE